MTYFIIILTISLFCVGLRTITDKGKIGYPLRQLVDTYLPTSIGKPLLLCATCMASFWGTLIYSTFFYQSLIQLILIIISASYLNAVLWALLNKLNK